MSGIPSAGSPRPEGPGAQPAGDTRPSVAHKRWTLKEMLPWLTLAVLGLAMLAGAYILYPRATELPTPPYSTLAVSATFPIFGITYAAAPKSSSTAVVTISVALPSGATSAQPVHLGVQMPFGTAFWYCPGRACTGPSGEPIQGAWGQALAFSSAGQASAKFFVKAANFGETSNGVNAAAAIPAVYDEAAGQPVLITAYRIQSADSYDWASFPAALANADVGVWNEPLAKGYTPGRAAVGIDHAAQSHDDFMNLLAGALIGLGGAAILAAIVEAVHTRDWDVIRALRPK